MELTRLAARLLWRIAERSKNGGHVSRRTVSKCTGSAISAGQMQEALQELILAGLIVRRWGLQSVTGSAPIVYALTETARAMEIKKPRKGTPRTGQANATSVRLPHELRRQLEQSADAGDLALNAEIIRRLEASFKRERKNAHEPVYSRDVGSGTAKTDFSG